MAYRADTNDWNTLTASLTQDEYGLPQGMSGYALDVGGYLGSVGIALALDNPAMYVTIIEPVPANCDLIERNIALNNVDDRVILIRGAVGRGGEHVTVEYGYVGTEAAEHHAFVGNSSLRFDTAIREKVTYTGLGLWEFTPLDFLKIDCEGGEWAFLDCEVLVPVIVGEAHAIDGYAGLDIVAMLPNHTVTLSGDPTGTCGFRAVL
jgi:FkbM family methyltransferase